MPTWCCGNTPSRCRFTQTAPHLESFHRIGQPHVATLVQVGFKKKKKKCGISENKVDGVSSETVPAMEPPPGEV